MSAPTTPEAALAANINIRARDDGERNACAANLLDRLRASGWDVVRQKTATGHALFWDGNDPERGNHDPADILKCYDHGDVIEIGHGCYFYDRYHVRIPTDDDGNYEDREFATRAEAEAWLGSCRRQKRRAEIKAVKEDAP